MTAASATATGAPGPAKQKGISPAVLIIGAMVLGIVVGYMIFVNFPDKKTASQIAGYISIFSDIFLRLIKMLIAPLVFSTLVVGIAHVGDSASVGRVFAKALGWFIVASLVSLLLGLVLANALQPGKDLGLPLPDIGAPALPICARRIIAMASSSCRIASVMPRSRITGAITSPFHDPSAFL